MNTNRSDCLAITASGEDRVGLVEKLTDRITQAGCNIEHSRMGVLGGQFALMMLVTGSRAALSGLKEQLAALGAELALAVVHQWTHRREAAAPFMPYRVEVVALDHPGIVHGLASFFSGQGINIEELDTDVYAAPHTGSPMFAVHMTVGVPAQTQISALREAFVAYCDGLNLDATIEPWRG